ncbi:MAG: F-box protein [Alphaproteobacteria bacterium]|nr:F-box protein [Alphaproteobacteria bacterium]
MKNIIALGCILTSISYSNSCAMENTPGIGNLSTLPQELIIDIFKRLDIKATSTSKTVSRKFNELLCSEEVKKSFESSPVAAFCQKEFDPIYFTEEVRKAALSVADNSDAPILAKLNAYSTLYTFSLLKHDRDNQKEYARKYVDLYQTSKVHINEFAGEDKEHLKEMKRFMESFLKNS